MALLFRTFLMIFLAEMGDKSQFLTIAMTAEYRPRTVLAGSGAAIVLLNLLAVSAGTVLGDLLPRGVVSLASGTAFLCFALLGIGGEDEKENAMARHGGFALTAILGTYFLAELGDKTQLTVLTLSTEAEGAPFLSAVLVLIGASAGLFAADALALLVGVLLGKRLPARAFRTVSVLLFAVCGSVRLLLACDGFFARSAHKTLFSALVTSAVVAAFFLLGAARYRRAAKDVPHTADSHQF